MRVLAVCCCALLVSGCVLVNPFGRRVALLQSQAAFLEGRVEQLEFSRGYGPLVPPTGAGFVTGSGTGSLEAFNEPLMAGSLSAAPSSAAPVLSSVASVVPARAPGVPMNGRKAMEKLGRGIINLVTGWVEVPKRMDETNKRSGLGPALTIGILRGLGHGFARETAGAYEIATFPFPAPPDYRPIIQPEYVFTDSERTQQEEGEP